MAHIFWVKCPNCDSKFYAHIADFRGRDREMICPFCSDRFRDTEAAAIWEEGDPPDGWWAPSGSSLAQPTLD
jgi:predicted Zn finger-like uncharacterized protein